MDLVVILKYVAAVAALLVIVSVLLQSQSGGGLGVIGGSSGGEAYRSKRGLEAVLQNVTIISVIALGVSALAIAILSLS